MSQENLPLLVAMAKGAQEDSDNWFPDVSNDLRHHTLGLAGEVGEFANLVKKIDRGTADPSSDVVRYDLAMELADIFIYTLTIAALLQVDLEALYNVKRTENATRFG